MADRQAFAALTGAHGIHIAASEHGPRDGFPVILSHGGGQTRFAWGRTAQAMADRGFHVLSLDLRGQGDSAWVGSDSPYDISDHAEDVRRVAATLSRPPLLVGASLGGLASLIAAGEPPYPDIAGLCLVDVAPHLRAEGVAAVLGFMRRTADGFDTLEDAAAAIAAYLPHRPPPSDTEGLRKNLRRSEDGRYHWHWDPRAIDYPLDPVKTNPRIEEAARHVRAPALLLRGERSELVTHEVAEVFMTRFAQGRTHDIPGARHMVAGDRNDLFGKALLSFAEQLRAAQGAEAALP